MVVDRVLTEVLSAFSSTVVGDFSAEDVLLQLVQGAVRALGVDGAGVMVPEGDDLLRFVYAAGARRGDVEALEELQEQLQNGPCKDCHLQERLVSVADLGTEGDWPAYQLEAVRAGLRSITALPLRARGRGWGVLDLYLSEPGRLDPEQLAAARTLADVATSYLVVTADRDTARRAQEELAHRAMHDPLTGLPVRWVLLEQLAHALARLERHPGHVGVLFGDLDGLKYVNDTYGHGAGDRLLVTCVERVRAALRPTDVVARVGGDEFVVLLEDVDGVEAAAGVARRVLAELAAPYRPDGEVLQPSASVGVAVTTDPAVTPDALIAHADSAMYRAKRAGRGRYEVFDPALYVAERARVSAQGDIVSALRQALREGQLALHYQPVVALTADGTGGDLHALEALVRWQHPVRGLLTAQEFVPQAELAGMMPEVGAWVLATACDQLARWDRLLGDRSPARLFVNVSVDELIGADFDRHLAAALPGSGIDAHRLTVEITETGLVTDPPAAAAGLAVLLERGCELAIDDFGTGYSSLSRLVDLPASTLKIDRSFTDHMAERPAAVAVVSAVLQLGRQLGRTVVVEGVEDAPTLQALRQLGCTHAQGYHLGRPQPPEVVTAALAQAPDPARRRPTATR